MKHKSPLFLPLPTRIFLWKVLVVDAKLVNNVAYNDDLDEFKEFLIPDLNNSHSWQELAVSTATRRRHI